MALNKFMRSLFQKITKKPAYTWKGFLIAFILGITRVKEATDARGLDG